MVWPFSLYSPSVLPGTVGDHPFFEAGIVASPKLISPQGYARPCHTLCFPCSTAAYPTVLSPVSVNDSVRHFNNLLPSKQNKCLVSFVSNPSWPGFVLAPLIFCYYD